MPKFDHVLLYLGPVLLNYDHVLLNLGPVLLRIDLNMDLPHASYLSRPEPGICLVSRNKRVR